jgi:PPOX class probable F420-dependent enzyme
MTSLPEPARDLILAGTVAHLATIDPDCTPHVTCAWVDLDDDELSIGTLSDQRKLKNLRRDPRVTLSFESGDISPFGLAEYLVVYGRARITEGGAPELLQKLAHRYLGPDVKFPPMDDPPPGFVTHITVERIAGVGPWTSS